MTNTITRAFVAFFLFAGMSAIAPSLAPALTIPISVATSTPTTPPGTADVETPVERQAVAQKMGADGGNGSSSTTFPWDQTATNLGFQSIRGGASNNNSGFLAEYARLSSQSPYARGAHCASASQNIYVQTAGIQSAVDNMVGAVLGQTGSASLTASAAGQGVLACSFYELQNEADNIVSGEASGSVINANTLSSAVTAGTQTTQTAAQTNTCTQGGNYLACAASTRTIFIDLEPGTSNEEEVALTSSTSSSSAATTITFTPTKSHAAGAAYDINPGYQLSWSQATAYAALKQNATYAAITLTTVPLATPINDTVWLDNAMEAYAGVHLWQESDALNFHQGNCSGGALQSTFTNLSQTVSRTLGPLGYTAATYPWSKPAIVGEAIIDAEPDTFGNGSATTPWVPSTVGGCSLPEEAAAIYDEFGPLYEATLNLPIAVLETPVVYDGASGILNNSYLDASYNPKPNYYTFANLHNFLYDANYNPATYTPSNVTVYVPPSLASNWCLTDSTYTTTTGGSTSTTARSPAGCNIFHRLVSNQDGSEQTLFIQQMQSGGLYQQQTQKNANNATIAGTSTNVGAAAGVPAPSMVPTLTPTTATFYVGSGLLSANVYQFDAICNIPSNVQSNSTYFSNPDSTPAPTFTTAANNDCHNSVLIGSPTASGGYIPLSLPIGNATLVVHMFKSPTPGATITPIPMLSPLPTPASGTTWNTARNGVPNNIVAQ